MTEELMSANAFKWVLTVLTGGLAGTWFIYDSISLFRSSGKPTDPVSGDKRFGYMIGILIGAVGVIGCLKFHDVV
jgi:hypothetical protein